MARTIGIGKQDFERIRTNDNFYVDKTRFIKEWWEREDDVTLITRPRRFGKTLTMSMVEKFFSLKYADRGDLFEGLFIWEEEKYRKLQGTYPVISLSFANVKEKNYEMTIQRIGQLLADLYNEHRFLLEGELLSEEEKRYYLSISMNMPEVVATMAVHRMSSFLSRYYKKKVIILLDEYDTPMQEAYVDGYWDELVSYTRSLFNATFKTNPYLECGIMAGITRVSRESVFSDLNNLKVVTTTSEEYADCFGFTKEEMGFILEEYSLCSKAEEVEQWYDGFTFGKVRDIYNPWSIVNFLDRREVGLYWANTSSNSLVARQIQEGDRNLKVDFENLMQGGSLKVQLDEQIVYDRLKDDETAIWSLLLASGYLKMVDYRIEGNGYDCWRPVYELSITNLEVKLMFRSMIHNWFGTAASDYNDFIQALLKKDVDAMNEYMNRVAMSVFSFFDTGKNPAQRAEPERFYHGFVLGLMVDLADSYDITSNRGSGFGRYDVVLFPKKENLDAVVIEFKVHNPRKEKSLEETVKAAITQIGEKQYCEDLKRKGIEPQRIRCLGFAFEGKKVLIGEEIL
ncbi:MAG: AAA family ATPase [Eubacteriales bacterium]|nr:AAA family ATPase [Eubacteriales bacterium]